MLPCLTLGGLPIDSDLLEAELLKLCMLACMDDYRLDTQPDPDNFGEWMTRRLEHGRLSLCIYNRLSNQLGS